jgi:hypothetical protein
MIGSKIQGQSRLLLYQFPERLKAVPFQNRIYVFAENTFKNSGKAN